MNLNVSCVKDMQCQLGEGLHWDATRQCLWGVDIHGCKVWCWCLGEPVAKHWQVGQRVGWVLPVAGGAPWLLLGLQEGVALARADTLAFERWVHQPFTGAPAMRLNDAKADTTGAVWCGSLNNDDETQPVGCLYRLGIDGTWRVVDAGYTVANGPAIDATQKILMHTDSRLRTIYRFDLDAASGTLDNKRVWKVFSEYEGYPDGMCFDAETTLWVAHWGAGSISRFALDGTLLSRVELPASHITNVCFGGPALDRLFVTSARVGLSSQQLALQPLAGCLFEVQGHGAIGLPSLPAELM